MFSTLCCFLSIPKTSLFGIPTERRSTWSPYLGRQEITPYVEQFARQIATQVDWATVPFLTEMSRHIHDNFSYQQRPEGRAFPPEDHPAGAERLVP